MADTDRCPESLDGAHNYAGYTAELGRFCTRCERPDPTHDMTCGTCGRTWNSHETPTPAARCPFEYEHDETDDDDDDDDDRHIAVKLAAPNDVNGNPRRGWLILDADGNAVAFVAEEYAGRGALRNAYPHAVESVQVNVAAREYASWVRYNDTECSE